MKYIFGCFLVVDGLIGLEQRRLLGGKKQIKSHGHVASSIGYNLILTAGL